MSKSYYIGGDGEAINKKIAKSKAFNRSRGYQDAVKRFGKLGVSEEDARELIAESPPGRKPRRK